MKQVFLAFFTLVAIITISYGQTKPKSEVEKMLRSSNTKSASLLATSNTDYVVKSSHTDEKLGLEHVYLQQTYKSIKVYNVTQSLVFKNGKLQYNSGKFFTDIASKAPSELPVVAASDAINKAITYLGLSKSTSLAEVTNTFAADKKIIFNDGGIAKSNINTELLWVSTDEGKSIHLAWNVEVEPTKGSDYWHIRVDALTGKILSKGNYTVHERSNNKNTLKKKEAQYTSLTQVCDEEENSKSAYAITCRLMAPPPPPTVTTAQYNVIPYPSESPFITGPTLVKDPWTLSGTGNSATTYGWHFDGSINYKTSRGNNVYVYDDSLDKDKPGRPDTSSTAIPSLTFNFTPDFTAQPFSTSNRKFAEANLFYWNNIMHDLSYQYGFTEAAGNFQNNNISRGGLGADYVRAEAQDGSGMDNSNFSTLPDGKAARMQMYLFNSNLPTANKISVSSPSTIAGDYNYVEGAISASNLLSTTGPITGEFVLYNDDAAGTTHNACNGAPANSIKGKIALIDRSTCTFVSKVNLAQAAGAIAVIMINRVDSTIKMSGSDNTITIPAVSIIKSDGDKIKAKLAAGDKVTGTINVGILFDGDLDNGVIAHEYTHGISNRLTGGASTTSCLDNYEEGGEGWSDYIALMATTDWKNAKTTDGSISRIMGNYVWDQTPTTQGGIRTYPYTTDMSINPHTYKDVGDTKNNPELDTAGIPIPNATEVHYVGEVMCTVLWDMTWSIIKQEGAISGNLFDATATGGNNVALQLVMQGLKLQPCNPGFIDARDAILAADSILYKNAHKCAIWSAFARRGMGLSAKQGSSNVCGDEKVAYDVPPCSLPVKLIDFNAVAGNNKVVLKWKASSEINASGYAVEYSSNGTTWTSIGFLNASNSGGTNQYTTTHYQPKTGTNYYRLKITDRDGSFTYSKTSTVNFFGKAGLAVYPNPVKANLTAELYSAQSEVVQIKIIDVAGRIIQSKMEQTATGANTFQLNTTNLSKGTYFLVVEGATKEIRQFIKE